MKAVIVEESSTKPTYHNATLAEVAKPKDLDVNQALIEIQAVSFNHRELWIRKGQYPVCVLPMGTSSEYALLSSLSLSFFFLFHWPGDSSSILCSLFLSLLCLGYYIRLDPGSRWCRQDYRIEHHWHRIKT